MKESEDQNPQGLQDIFGRVADVKESVSESGFKKVDALRVMVSHEEFNAILGSCGVLRTVSLFLSLSW